MSSTERNPEFEERPKQIKVAVCAPPWVSIPPASYGGIEALLGDALPAYRNQNISTLLYSVGETARKESASNLSDDIGFVFEDGLYDTYIRHEDAPLIEAKQIIKFYEVLKKRIAEGQKFDLVHHHMMTMGTVFAQEKPIDLPHIITIHGPLEDQYKLEFLRTTIDKPWIYFTSISDNQGRRLPELNWVKTVHNGVDVKNFPIQEDKKDFLLLVGRFHPNKGQAEAIQVARELGKSLVLAGNVDDTEYFDNLITKDRSIVRADTMGTDYTSLELTQAVLERARRPEIIYFGEAGFEDKVWLYQNAKVFVNPLNWEEPFGLVMVESMACGTPVVSTARGAAPEIIDDGKTGYLVSNLDEMVKKINDIYENPDLISPLDCRRRVEEHFSNESMAAEYREAYDEVLRRERLRA